MDFLLHKYFIFKSVIIILKIPLLFKSNLRRSQPEIIFMRQDFFKHKRRENRSLIHPVSVLDNRTRSVHPSICRSDEYFLYEFSIKPY